mmetsp:Transcript_18416/g.39902  ORF Transcript_18416/g.39902 Transcript_18416/m.39902 type:complete len:545 (-) Transcript_18416:57-1691(-)
MSHEKTLKKPKPKYKIRKYKMRTQATLLCLAGCLFAKAFGTTCLDIEQQLKSVCDTVVNSTDSTFNQTYHGQFQQFSTPAKQHIKYVTFPGNETQALEILKIGHSCNIRVIPRGGGHSYIGASVYTQEDSIILQTRDIKLSDSATEKLTIDQNAGTVRVGSGLLLGELYQSIHETAPGRFFLAGGTCPSVGMGIVFGGGKGMYSRKYGYLCDNVISMRVVVYNKSENKFQVVVATKDVNHDLFSALLGGGGGNYGLVTELTFNLVPLHPDSDGKNIVTMYYGNIQVDNVKKSIAWSTGKTASDTDTYTRIQAGQGRIDLHALCQCDQSGCDTCLNALGELNRQTGNRGSVGKSTAHAEAGWEGDCHRFPNFTGDLRWCTYKFLEGPEANADTVHKSMDFKSGFENKIQDALDKIKGTSAMWEIDVIGGLMHIDQGNSYKHRDPSINFNIQIFQGGSDTTTLEQVYQVFSEYDANIAYPDYPDPTLFGGPLPGSLHHDHYFASPQYQTYINRYMSDVANLTKAQCKYNSIDMFKFSNYVGSIQGC